jgi:anti-anti-sigma factor
MTELNSADVKIKGDMDAMAAPQLHTIFQTTLAETNGNICLDMTEVGFLDSSGIGAVLTLYRLLRVANRKLEIVIGDGQPADLLAYLKVDGIISMQPAAPRL